jgi:hypothetical protein
MKRISLISLACLSLLVVPLVAAATPNPSSAVLKTRIFNDCPFSTVTTVNNYPSLISIQDAGLACSGFANMHNWTFSTDGVNGAVYNNDSDFRISTDLVITGRGEGGLRISPWYSKDVDGLFNVRSTDGEIACFGGRLPFYTFTGVYGLRYTAGQPIHLEMAYKPHGLNASSPATVEYSLTYQGTTYSSGALNFDQANPAEDPPYGLWGMLNDGRVGGHVKGFMSPGDFGATTKATFTNIRFVICPIEPNPDGAAIKTRVFNDCPLTTLTVTNNYPSQISFNDAGLACSGFANLHVWTYSDDGHEAVFNNDDDFRIATDMVITGRGEGGLRVSPWYSHDADGLFNVRSTDGEIACFGGRLPFYTFTGVHGLHYAAGDPIHLEIIYKHNGLSGASPGTIEYKLGYLGNNYTSGPLNMDQANPGEDPPHGLWGILNDARVGGHVKAFMTPGDFSATTNATFTNIVFQSGVAMDVAISPNSLNLKSGGNKVTVFLEPPAPYTPADIDFASLRINGVAGPVPGSALVGDHDSDGIPELQVKFPRIAVQESAGDNGLVSITGSVGGSCFEGSALFKKTKVTQPSAGATLAPGSIATIAWDTPQGATITSVDILLSLDNGESWSDIAQGLSNTGSYAWTVPSQISTSARIAVVLDDGTSDGIAGVSGVFSIQAPVGVGGSGEVAFRLNGTVPNPSRGGPLSVQFSLPDGKRATLSLFDVSGRRLASREVGTLGAGRHLVSLAQRLPAGLYMIKLDREGASLTTRAAVVR